MSKKSEYSKVFGGKTKYDFDVKKKKNKNSDIFFNETSKKKKKKKKKPDKVEKVIKDAIREEIGDNDNILNDFIIWDKIKDSNIKTFKDISERCNGLFVVEVSINSESKALVPISITKNKTVVHAETGERIEEVFAHYTTDGEITEIDLKTAVDALFEAEIVDSLYRIDTTKLMENINTFDIDDE